MYWQEGLSYKRHIKHQKVGGKNSGNTTSGN